MKNLLKLVASFVMVLAMVFGINVTSAEAYDIEFVCDASGTTECMETLAPDQCLKVTDNHNDRSFKLAQISNFNSEVDANISVGFDGGNESDYYVESDAVINYALGGATNFKVCNISNGGSHPLIVVSYPHFIGGY